MKTFELPDPAGKAGGACTSALLQTLYRDEDEDDIRYTWAETLELMREKIEEIGLNQQPQLSSSRPIDVNEELHIVPPDCEGTKRALLVGINYEGEHNALTGCQKDARNVKEFLINVCGFERENMLILMDDGKHHQPTKQLIEDGLTRLAEISEPGDCIFFQFSGMSLVLREGKRASMQVHVTNRFSRRDSLSISRTRWSDGRSGRR